MTLAYRPDRTQFTTQAFRYESFGKYVFTCNISGTLADSTIRRFQFSVRYTDSRVQARAMVVNPTTGLLAPLTTGGVLPNYSPGYEIYDYAGNETVYTDQHFEEDGEYFVVNFLIQNISGAPINLITQEVDIWVEFYEAPLTWG